jgi:hypothetical protein
VLTSRNNSWKQIFIFPLRYYANCVSTTLTVLITLKVFISFIVIPYISTVTRALGWILFSASCIQLTNFYRVYVRSFVVSTTKLYSFLWVIPRRLNVFLPTFRLCSIFIGVVNRKNNRDEIIPSAYTAYEDVTVFRNVGIYNLDDGE